MASWIEIDRIRKDARAVRALAKHLLAFGQGLTSWEVDFLESMARHRGPDELTTRQGEKLLQIRDDTEFISEHRSFSVRILLDQCFAARVDLDEDDERWVTERRGRTSIQRREIGRLMRCARRLYLIENEEAA